MQQSHSYNIRSTKLHFQPTITWYRGGDRSSDSVVGRGSRWESRHVDQLILPSTAVSPSTRSVRRVLASTSAKRTVRALRRLGCLILCTSKASLNLSRSTTLKLSSIAGPPVVRLLEPIYTKTGLLLKCVVSGDCQNVADLRRALVTRSALDGRATDERGRDS